VNSFVRINGTEDDGEELLPKSIAATMEVGDRKSIWIVPETKETVYVPLLKLGTGCLLYPRSKDSKPSGRRSKPSGSGKKKGNQSSDAKIQNFCLVLFPWSDAQGPCW
jgi:hypothetical protein